jgi:hypothetical protein
MADIWAQYGREILAWQGFGVPQGWGERELEAYGQKMGTTLQQRGAYGQQQPQAQQSYQSSSQAEYDPDDLVPYSYIQQKEKEFQQWMEAMVRKQEADQQTVYELVRIKHELDELGRQQKYSFDPQQLARHMYETNQPDARKAWETFTAPQREQRGYDRGRQEQLEEDRARGRVPVTTTKSYQRGSESQRTPSGQKPKTWWQKDQLPGDPFRPGQSRYGYDSPRRKDQILDTISERTGIPRDDRPAPEPSSLIRQTFSKPGEGNQGNQGSEGNAA